MCARIFVTLAFLTNLILSLISTVIFVIAFAEAPKLVGMLLELIDKSLEDED